MLFYFFRPTQHKEKIEAQCGQHKMVLTCGKTHANKTIDPYDERICANNSLELIPPDKTHKKISVPKKYVGHNGTPAALQCHQGKHSKLYWVVSYNFSCKHPICYLHEVYTENGRHLTIHDRRANHEYDRVSGELELQPINAAIFIEEQDEKI